MELHEKKYLIPLVIALMAVFSGGEAFAQLPKTYKEFKQRYQVEGKTPEGALKLHLEAIFCYINPETRSEASKMLRYSMYFTKPLEQSTVHVTFMERMREPDYNFVFRSFAKGTSPQNDYQMSPDNFTLNIVKKRNSEGFLKLDLRSSGADNIRSVWLLNHDGLWYVHNNAGLYAMVREPLSVINARKKLHDADEDSDLPPDPPSVPESQPLSEPGVNTQPHIAPQNAAPELSTLDKTAPQDTAPQNASTPAETPGSSQGEASPAPVEELPERVPEL